MLGLYRRHQKHCPHLSKGREHLRCPCPLWVDGRLNGERIHKALGTADWQKAQQIVRDLETGGKVLTLQSENEPITIEKAWERFVTDLEVRKLHASTVRKYRLLKRQMQEFAKTQGLNLLRQLET